MNQEQIEYMSVVMLGGNRPLYDAMEGESKRILEAGARHHLSALEWIKDTEGFTGIKGPAGLKGPAAITNESLNTGHGHVFPRPDGRVARCGGPTLCGVCFADLAKKQNASL